MPSVPSVLGGLGDCLLWAYGTGGAWPHNGVERSGKVLRRLAFGARPERRTVFSLNNHGSELKRSADYGVGMLPVGFPGAAFSAWRERFTAGVPFWKNGLVLSQYNKDLWKGNIPSTTDELLAYAQANTDTNAGTYGVLNQHTGAYNVAPFINGYGGYIINNDAKPGLNLQATKDAVAYNKRFSAYQSDGEYNTVTTLFTEKKAHSIISGPWLVSSIKAAGINLGTKPLTSFKLPNGKPMCPYIGVQSFGVCKHALTKKTAIAKLFNVIASKEMGVSMAKDFGCTPAVSAAYEDSAVTSNEMIANTKATVATSAIPMPNIPEMSVMWVPTSNLLTNVNVKGADVDTEADAQQKAAEQAIADMH